MPLRKSHYTLSTDIFNAVEKIESIAKVWEHLEFCCRLYDKNEGFAWRIEHYLDDMLVRSAVEIHMTPTIFYRFARTPKQFAIVLDQFYWPALFRSKDHLSQLPTYHDCDGVPYKVLVSGQVPCRS